VGRGGEALEVFERQLQQHEEEHQLTKQLAHLIACLPPKLDKVL